MRAPGGKFSPEDEASMRRALRLAERGYGGTAPNPMVGALVVHSGKILGEGWHRRAGEPHAEVNAIRAALRHHPNLRGATLYVTLEPCCTFGRTPPCTAAIIESGIKSVVVGVKDPNTHHSGKGFSLLRKAGISVRSGLLAEECIRLNEAFHHWIVQRQPFVVCKCAMSLDGKIATNSGDSKWITGETARRFGMRLRVGADAIVAGVNTILRDDPALTLRPGPGIKIPKWKQLQRIVLDPTGRIPETARVLNDEHASLTTVIVTSEATQRKMRALERRVRVVVAPAKGRDLNLRWLLTKLAKEGITSLLVEGGGETHSSFLRRSLVNRVYFFYAPIVMTGRDAPKSVAGEHSLARGKGVHLTNVEWSQVGDDLLCSALVQKRRK